MKVDWSEPLVLVGVLAAGASIVYYMSQSQQQPTPTSPKAVISPTSTTFTWSTYTSSPSSAILVVDNFAPNETLTLDTIGLGLSPNTNFGVTDALGHFVYAFTQDAIILSAMIAHSLNQTYVDFKLIGNTSGKTATARLNFIFIGAFQCPAGYHDDGTGTCVLNTSGGGTCSVSSGSTSSMTDTISATKSGTSVTADVGAHNNETCTRTCTINCEIRDSRGVTQGLAFQTVTVSPGQTSHAGFTFQGLTTGTYQVRAFNVTSLSSSIILSPIATRSITV